MSLTIIGAIILTIYGSSESFFGSIISLILLAGVFMAVATEFGFITP